MTQSESHISNKNLLTPRAAAMAGILFAVLFGTSYTLILRSMPGWTRIPVPGWHRGQYTPGKENVFPWRFLECGVNRPFW